MEIGNYFNVICGTLQVGTGSGLIASDNTTIDNNRINFISNRYFIKL